MSKIMAIPIGMRNMAKEIGTRVSNIQSAQKTMCELFGRLRNSFRGKMPDVMLQRALHMEKAYRRIVSDLEKYKNVLEKRADWYEKTDEEAADKFNALVVKNKKASRWIKLRAAADSQ